MNRGKNWVQNTATTVRILMAFVFVVSGISYFFSPVTAIIGDPGSPSGVFIVGLLNTGYFLPFLKVTEIISGLILFSKRFSAFALVILAPIIVQIFLYAIFLNRAITLVAIILGAVEIFLAWYNWHKFAPLFKKA